MFSATWNLADTFLVMFFGSLSILIGLIGFYVGYHIGLKHGFEQGIEGDFWKGL